jgi:uncharacterized protein YuzE
MTSMTVKIAGIEFDRIDYDRDADVLYLHVGEPANAVDWDDSEEGHALRYGPDGSIVGITIVNARRTLEADGEVAITLPRQRVVARDLGPVLAAA